MKNNLPIQGRILSATISQVPSGKYYVSICCDNVDMEPFEKTGAVVGIDLGIKDFVITSDGVKISNPDKLMSIGQQWKAYHEKKELEIETVDICRIIEILPDGRKRCVHEEDIDLPFDGYERQRVEEILKRYCMEHDGEYIAVREVVSRVKAVK